MKKVEGLRGSHGDVKYSTGHIVSDVVISMGGARWVLEISEATLYKVHDCLTPMLYT